MEMQAYVNIRKLQDALDVARKRQAELRHDASHVYIVLDINGTMRLEGDENETYYTASAVVTSTSTVQRDIAASNLPKATKDALLSMLRS